MSKYFVQPGDTMKRANPGGSAANAVVKVGRLFGVTLNGSATEPTGNQQVIGVEGVFSLPKLAEGLAQGTPVYWDTTGVGATPTGGFPIGTVWDTALTGDVRANVKLLGNLIPTGMLPTNPASMY